MMARKKGLFALVSTMIIVSLLLSGCMAQLANTSINRDGSGKITVEFGLSEEAMATTESMVSDMFGEGIASESSSDVDYDYVFEYNGIKYVGEKDEFEFKNLQELSDYLNGLSEYTDDAESDRDFFKAYQESTGEFVLEFVADRVDADSFNEATIDNSAEEEEPERWAYLSPEEIRIQEEEIRKRAESAQAMISSLAVKLTFNMPASIYQIEGPSVGIDINDNVLVMDIIALSSYITDEVKIVFKTDPINDLTAYKVGQGRESGTDYIDLETTVEGTEVELSGQQSDETVGEIETSTTVEVEETTKFTGHFKDVANDAWYYPAIEALAGGGLVHGFGDGTFRPDDVITYAQLCTIIANGKRLTYGDSVGYWAYDSIYACISNGYLTDLSGLKSKGKPFDEAITPELYDRPVTRVWGVTTLVKASKSKLEDIVSQHGSTGISIPDANLISKDFLEYIKLAYASGMITGMDESHTFSPESYMTRGQVAQILYNMGWINSI